MAINAHLTRECAQDVGTDAAWMRSRPDRLTSELPTYLWSLGDSISLCKEVVELTSATVPCCSRERSSWTGYLQEFVDRVPRSPGRTVVPVYGVEGVGTGEGVDSR